MRRVYYSWFWPACLHRMEFTLSFLPGAAVSSVAVLYSHLTDPTWRACCKMQSGCTQECFWHDVVRNRCATVTACATLVALCLSRKCQAKKTSYHTQNSSSQLWREKLASIMFRNSAETSTNCYAAAKSKQRPQMERNEWSVWKISIWVFKTTSLLSKVRSEGQNGRLLSSLNIGTCSNPWALGHTWAGGDV